MTILRDLYPAIEPYLSGHFPVDDIHTLYWEECGNPKGIPVVFLHGGPGGGCSATSRRFFDPARYRIVLFDQRGAGRSTPNGELRNNTTAHLIADLEALRQLRRVDAWHVFGGSWGSTLAVAYAHYAAHPVVAGALRGMGAAAAGLILSTGLKLVPALRRNALGAPAALVLAALTFAGIALLRVPLVWMLAGLGGLACVAAWRRLAP